LASGADARKMVGVYVLKKGDFSVKISNWGATIMSIVTPDSKGTHDDFLASISNKSWLPSYPAVMVLCTM
jgi:hypothetical protein